MHYLVVYILERFALSNALTSAGVTLISGDLTPCLFLQLLTS